MNKGVPRARAPPPPAGHGPGLERGVAGMQAGDERVRRGVVVLIFSTH